MICGYFVCQQWQNPTVVLVKPERRWYRVSVGALQVAMLVLPVALLLILGPLGCGDKPAQAPNGMKQAPSAQATSQDAVAAIERLGGWSRWHVATAESYLVADLEQIRESVPLRNRR
jgi:hypothetical protein